MNKFFKKTSWNHMYFNPRTGKIFRLPTAPANTTLTSSYLYLGVL